MRRKDWLDIIELLLYLVILGILMYLFYFGGLWINPLDCFIGICLSLAGITICQKIK